jgi:hypothetical protein
LYDGASVGVYEQYVDVYDWYTDYNTGVYNYVPLYSESYMCNIYTLTCAYSSTDTNSGASGTFAYKKVYVYYLYQGADLANYVFAPNNAANDYNYWFSSSTVYNSVYMWDD